MANPTEGSSRPRVFVSRPIPEAPLALLRERFNVIVGPPDRVTTADELRAGCSDAFGLVSVLTDRVDGPFLDVCPGLRAVANFGVGVDNIDLQAARERRRWVTNTPDVLTDATADLTLALLLACWRGLPQGERELREGRWPGWSPMHGIVPDVKVLGIIGLGRIGMAVARRARAFGLGVLYSSPRVPDVADFGPMMKRVELRELLETSDVVSLHCPLNASTRGILSRERLAQMKPGAMLINTARGPLVDELALAEALESGYLRAAGLDVFQGEPRVHPRLLAAPGTLLTPHLGSATASARNGMGQLAVQSLIDVLDGRTPANTVVGPVAWNEVPG